MSAADYVWALVSGLPKSERERRLIMALQGFVDDSGSEPQGPIFVLAGFVASPLQWVDFTDEWERTLHLPPGVNYFRNNEAMGLKGQFSPKRGWDERKRDDRLVALARVIRDYLPERFAVFMRHSDYERYIHGIPVEKKMRNLESPYFLLFYEIMLLVACVHSMGTFVDPCQFVFDDQGKLGFRSREWWATFRDGTRTADKADLSRYLAESKPNFGSDKELRPLQAADLYAGQLAKKLGSMIWLPPSPSLSVVSQIKGGQERPVDYRYLYQLRRRFMTMAREIDAKEPGRLKYELGRPTKKRLKE
jgi:hypothetical protein